STRVVTGGGIPPCERAESILERGGADCVAAARQTLADPDWFRKIRLGRGDLVRRCEFTNYCEGLDQRHKQVTCKLWDRQIDAADPAMRLASDGQRRLTAPPRAPQPTLPPHRRGHRPTTRRPTDRRAGRRSEAGAPEPLANDLVVRADVR